MRGSLGRNVVASMANAIAVIGSLLIAVPVILDAVGTAGYGVWSLGLAVIVYLSLVEVGLGPAVQRYAAVARGAGDRAELARILWTALVTYVLAGVIGLVALNLAAGPLVDVFDLPRGLRADAEEMFRILGITLAVALLAAGSGNLVAGMERFGALALSSAAGALGFLVAVIVLADDKGLPGLAVALTVQHCIVLACRAWTLRSAALGSRPALVARSVLRSMVRFSARLQVSAFAELFNSQSDKVLVGLVAPISTVGQLGIGAQIADGGRLVAGAALGPVVSSFSVSAGARDEAALRTRFAAVQRIWVLGMLGAGVIGAASLQPLIEAWLGAGYDEAALLGTALVLAGTAALSTGTGIAYLRAIGEPGLEARYGVLVVLVNLALTIPLALLAGARGAVAGTLGAYLVGVAWFFARLSRKIPVSPVRDRRDAARVVAWAVAAGAAALGWGLLAVELTPRGVALVLVAFGDLCALAAYSSAALGLRPTPATIRRWLASAPA